MNKINEFTDELLNGKGYIMIPSVFSSQEIKEANDLINFYIENEDQKTTHFQDL